MYFVFSLLLALNGSAETRIDPQFVVNRILGEGYESKTIDLNAQQAYTSYYNTYGLYDWNLAAAASYSDSRIQNLSGGGNLRDKTSLWNLGLSKRLHTGTTLGVNFSRTLQNSTYRPNSSALRPSYGVYDVGEVTIKQDILGNFFGIAERKNLRVAEQLLSSAEMLQKEQQEQLVLDSLKLFWDSYVAKESLREAIAQRDKYEALVKEIQSKTKLGFVNPGDLPKALAEFGAQVRNVKNSSYNYLENLSKLVTAMRLEEKERDLRFEVREDLPALPEMSLPAVENLRLVKVNQVKFDSAELTKRATDISADWPELYLEGKAGYTGLESTQGKAFASMTSGNHPVYSASLNLSYSFFSAKNKASKNEAAVNYEQSFNDLLSQKDEQIRFITSATEKVRLTHVAALSAIDETSQWEKAVREQERSYRQGRLDFSQLIQDYNSYFRSRATRIRAIGDYHIALHAYAAAVDQLVR
jgi:outer membrane protein TolC